MIVPQHYFDKLPAPLEGEVAQLKQHAIPDQITTTYGSSVTLMLAVVVFAGGDCGCRMTFRHCCVKWSA